MINVSTACRETIKTRRDFRYEAHVTLADGTHFTLDDRHMTITGNSMLVDAGGESLPIGKALGRQCILSIYNTNDEFTDYDFFEATITLTASLEMDNGTFEIIDLGKFTVIEPETPGDIITLTAIDAMHKADVPYHSELMYPVRMVDVLNEAATQCGLVLSAMPENSRYTVRYKPEDMTCRDVIAGCAMIAGGNAIISTNGYLKIRSYDFSAFSEEIDPLSYKADVFPQLPTHIISHVSALTVGTDDIIITGVKMGDDETSWMAGNEGYVLTLENPLASGNEQTLVDYVYGIMGGHVIRQFNADSICYPFAEFMDPAYVIDVKDRVYQSVITNVDFTLGGKTVLKCTADSPARRSAQYTSSSNKVIAKAVVKAREAATEAVRAREALVNQISEVIAQSLGFFTSYEETENGGFITYTHDKPDLASSTVITKQAADGYTVSNDGGKTWHTGYDATTGNMFLNMLSAVGIRAEWIKVEDLFALGATIGGWKITQDYIYTDSDPIDDGYVARTYLAKAQNADSWVYSAQAKAPDGTLTGKFYIDAGGRQWMAPTAGFKSNIYFAQTDTNGVIWPEGARVFSQSDGSLRLAPGNAGSDSGTGVWLSKEAINPRQNDAYRLGSNNFRYSNVYAKTMNVNGVEFSPGKTLVKFASHNSATETGARSSTLLNILGGTYSSIVFALIVSEGGFSFLEIPCDIVSVSERFIRISDGMNTTVVGFKKEGADGKNVTWRISRATSDDVVGRPSSFAYAIYGRR